VKEISPELEEKLKKVKLLALDVDGVLTDGGVYIADNGKEFRRFDIKDGLGLKRVIAAGIEIAIISSGTCESVLHRAIQLEITEVHIGVADKLDVLKGICFAKQISLNEVCYIGDDLPDLPVMKAVGIACSPADAVEEVQKISDVIATAPGGKGAVRRVCNLILEA